MRTLSLLPNDCAWACQQVSVRLDSELSEFEEVRLEAHLERCPDCREYAESLTTLTEILRTAPAEEPALSFQLPRRRAVSARSTPRFRLTPRIKTRVFARRAISAAAVGVVALGGLVSLNLSATPTPGVDLRMVRQVRSLKERALEQMEVVAAPGPVWPGRNAIEHTTLSDIVVGRPQPTPDPKRWSFPSDR